MHRLEVLSGQTIRVGNGAPMNLFNCLRSGERKTLTNSTPPSPVFF